MIKYLCPHCKAEIGSPQSMLGKAEKCPRCGQSVRVPVPSPSPKGKLTPPPQPSSSRAVRMLNWKFPLPLLTVTWVLIGLIGAVGLGLGLRHFAITGLYFAKYGRYVDSLQRPGEDNKAHVERLNRRLGRRPRADPTPQPKSEPARKVDLRDILMSPPDYSGYVLESQVYSAEYYRDYTAGAYVRHPGPGWTFRPRWGTTKVRLQTDTGSENLMDRIVKGYGYGTRLVIRYRTFDYETLDKVEAWRKRWLEWNNKVNKQKQESERRNRRWDEPIPQYDPEPVRDPSLPEEGLHGVLLEVQVGE